MAKAFCLAEKGLGYTSPNPPVGAILIKNGEIVGAGYHRKAGLPHAEIEALKKAGEHARGATLVVTLEPCSHFGKTPPCADALIAAGVSKVVSATCDPNPVVSGSGYGKLRDAGIEVVDGVMKNYSREFYRPYFKYITTGLPFVTLKFAQSLDGRIATSSGHSQWISSQESLVFSHRLRAVSDAVLVGSGTLRKDNPKLTTRLVKGKNPIRIVLSASGRFPRSRDIFTDGQSQTYIATSGKVSINVRNGYEVINVRKGSAGLNLNDLRIKLGRMGIMNMLVEGGGGVLTSFLKQRQADKIVVCVAPMIIGKGIDAIGDLGIRRLDNAVRLDGVEFTKSGPDCIMSGYPVWR
ncbi:MAG: riboflavin biosynthesis protein RibD [candidate division Zixibacteria bacterium RBG_16_53_22]|nr:MAG: riboflavin biosynthesis protein RibD [candidate division Zixibacteria bacterium RBG_16_53_22]